MKKLGDGLRNQTIKFLYYKDFSKIIYSSDTFERKGRQQLKRVTLTITYDGGEQPIALGHLLLTDHDADDNVPIRVKSYKNV
jgi:hypothetical protein